MSDSEEEVALLCGIDQKRKKKRKKRKVVVVIDDTDEDILLPPHWKQLLAKNPWELTEYQPDFIDERASDPNAYTATGRLHYMPIQQMLQYVKVFDPTQVKLDAAFISFGKRRTGKSHFLREFCWCLHKILDRVIILTNTRHNGFFQRVPEDCRPPSLVGKRNGFVPAKAVIPGFDEQVVINFLDLQRKIFMYEDVFEKRGYKLPAMIWLDDIVDSRSARNSGQLGALCTTYALGRHFNMMVGMNTQYPKALGPLLRENVDYAVVFRQMSELDYEAVVDNYMGELPRQTAIELIRMTTHGEKDGPRQCLIIDMDPLCRAEDKYMTYMCCDEDELPDFIMGSKKFQEEGAFDRQEYYRQRMMDLRNI